MSSWSPALTDLVSWTYLVGAASPSGASRKISASHSPPSRNAAVSSLNSCASRLEAAAAYHAPSLARRATAAKESGSPASPRESAHTTGVAAMNLKHSMLASYLVGASQSIWSGAS